MYDDFDAEFGNRAAEDDRTRKVYEQPDGGCKIFIRNVDPHGFFKVFFEKGPVPKELRNSWTYLRLANADVEKYLNNKVLEKAEAVAKAEHKIKFKSEQAQRAQITRQENKAKAKLDDAQTEAG